MSDPVPNDEQRDRYLDELMSAYASGQIDSAEFAVRSDRVINGATIADLDAALAGIAVHEMPERSRVLTGFPQPVSSGSTLESARLDEARRSRRQALVLGGSIAFALAGCAAIFIAASTPKQESPTQQYERSSFPAVTATALPEAYPAPGGFLSIDSYGGYYRYTRGMIGRVTITNDLATLIVRPEDGTWQQVTITRQGRVNIQPAEPVANYFRASEAEISVLVEVVDASSQSLGEPVESIEFIRVDPNQPVQMRAAGASGAKVIWDAYSRVVIYVDNPRTSSSNAAGSQVTIGSGDASPATRYPSSTPTR